MAQGPGRPSKVLDDLTYIEYMAELWCCGSSKKTVRKISLIAANALYADGSPKLLCSGEQRLAEEPPNTNQLTPKMQSKDEADQSRAKPESVADRLARRSRALEKRGLQFGYAPFAF